MSTLRYHAPYMEWAKTRPVPEIDLAGSNILACTIDDLPAAADALSFSGANDNGYRPLMERQGETSWRWPRCSSRETTCWSSGRGTIRCWERRG
jgi:hypothetical protein